MSEGAYRCADCGNGDHLTAWAIIVAHGPLGADGHLTQYDWDEEDWLHEDSVQCAEHPDGVIEHFADGRLCRFWVCAWCGGDGRYCDYIKEHKGWRPAGEPPPPLPVGAGHVFDPESRQPIRKQDCQVCKIPLSSISGGRPCPGYDVFKKRAAELV